MLFTSTFSPEPFMPSRRGQSILDRTITQPLRARMRAQKKVPEPLQTTLFTQQPYILALVVEGKTKGDRLVAWTE